MRKRTVTLADVRKALKRSPFPRQYDEMVPLLFLCEELAARPVVRAKRPVVDVEDLTGEELSEIINARDATTITEAPRAIREVLEKIAKKQLRGEQ